MAEPKVGNKYNPGEIEKRWITRWEQERIYETPKRGDKPKSYVLGMFPYPSGEGLHTGHGRIFTAVDVIARYQRMKGYEVLCPVGWDAFGLPAENAAIKAHKNPVDTVPHNEANFKRQMMMLALSYDWERTFSTTDPAYYKWTQWLFLKLYSIKNDKGERLVYRKEVPINWCPFCKTGLANEEVLADGTHERCGNRVGQKLMMQWNMRITDYADRLLSDLDTVWEDGQGNKHAGLDWPEGILAMQRNWIGKKAGIEIDYQVVGSKEKITCFTTTPVNFGATFVVVSPENPILDMDLIPEEHRKKVEEYRKQAVLKTEQARLEGEKDKTGEFTGLYVVNHVTKEEIPVWVSDFVLMSVGTGAVQGCPGHDLRDFQFAQKYNLTIKRVVVGEDGDDSPIEREEKIISKGMKGKMINSGFLDGMDFEKAMEETKDYFVKKGWGRRVTSYHLRDWVFSRQRYWGEPFPLVYCPKCGDPTSLKLRGASENDTTVIDGKKYAIVPLPDEQLPLKLPYLASYEPTETGESPLARATDWVETICPVCGGPARRETDTMPNWAGSCWYFLRFADPNNTKEVWSKKALADWLPVDWYLGGAEHAVLHLLYARFWTKAFYDLGLLPFTEPFLRLRSVGMVLAEDGKKMSKSLGNIVSPDDVVAEYGADAVRIYEMFMGPWGQAISWSTRSLIGCRRFVEKVWDLVQRDVENNWKESDRKLAVALNKVIDKVGSDIVELKFNTAVAALMKFANTWVEVKTGLSREDMTQLLLVMAPLAPFSAEELWEKVGNKGSIHLAGWPEAKNVKEEEVVIVVSVNGKTRGMLNMRSEEAIVEEEVKEMVLSQEKFAKWIEGKKYKIVFVPGRIINFVVKG